jgi:hypothetical protein
MYQTSHTHGYDTAQDRKVEGMKAVSGGNKAWKDEGLNVIKSLTVGWTGTGEDIRTIVEELPSHPNAWGALIAAALKAELIYPTGEYRAMTAKASHARKTPVYERM